jgi:hypothetical protein
MDPPHTNPHLNTLLSPNGSRSYVGGQNSPNRRRSETQRSPTKSRRWDLNSLSLSLSPQRTSEPEYVISDEMLRTAERHLSQAHRRGSISPNGRRLSNVSPPNLTTLNPDTNLTTSSPTQNGARFFNDFDSPARRAFTEGTFSDAYVREAIMTYEASRNAVCAAESFSKVYAMREDDIVRALTPNARATAAVGMLSTGYVYIYIYTHTYIYRTLWTQLFRERLKHDFMHTLVYICVCVCMYVYTHTHTYTYKYINIYIHIRTYT